MDNTDRYIEMANELCDLLRITVSDYLKERIEDDAVDGGFCFVGVQGLSYALALTVASAAAALNVETSDVVADLVLSLGSNAKLCYDSIKQQRDGVTVN